jgi:ATP-dependent Clp protease protease subunit
MDPKPNPDIHERLLKDRIIFLGTPITDEIATEVIAKLLYLAQVSPQLPVNLYINSPGGSVTAAIAILNTIESLGVPVATYCIGLASSIAAVILASGTHGYRHALKTSEIAFSPVTLRDRRTPENQAMLARLESELIARTARATGIREEFIEEFFRDSVVLTSQRALELGIIDEIVSTRKPGG